MTDRVTLIGLDFGSTTSSAVVATARLLRSATTGRMQLADVCEQYRSPLVMTPLDAQHRLDEPKVEEYLDCWLAEGAVRRQEIFGGGALLTGLTAQRENAAALVRLIRSRLGEALIATADDPRLESWLAFMGSCAGLSRSRPHQPILNLDIGGGTTNLAWGINGQVLRTGCYFIGARHVQVVPGGYRIVRLSRFAQALFAHLGIGKGVADTLAATEVQAVLDFYLSVLEAAIGSTSDANPQPVAQMHVQVPFHYPDDPGPAEPAVTLSGGVGELVYLHLDGAAWPPMTSFGDLGIDLAQRLVSSPVWVARLNDRPLSAGRATVYGLLRHSTEVSGSTLFLPRPELLPQRDLPILGSLHANSTEEQIRDLIDLVGHSRRGGCIQVVLGTHEAAAVRGLAVRITHRLREAEFSPDTPLVLLLAENLGKVLGQYITQWGAAPWSLLVIDEVTARDAQYVQIGAPRNQVVGVSFYGLNE